MTDDLFNVRMRAAAADEHVSGAETITRRDGVEDVVQTMVARAFDHERGEPDEVTVSVDSIDREPVRTPTLPVVTVDASDVASSHRVARALLDATGVSHTAIERGFDVLQRATANRGAALLDASDGTRLDEDPDRGVRASRLGTSERGATELDAALAAVGLASTRIRDALVLATKVLETPGVVAELCWSDNHDYTAGYVATATGYYRFPTFTEPGDPQGGRAFFLAADADVERAVEFLEDHPLLVDGVRTFERTTPDAVLRLLE